MNEPSIFTLENYSFSNGVHKMISAKDYDDFDSAWHDACGPTQVPEIPDCDYSSITETILFRRRSNDYNLPDEFDYFEQKPKYFILNPDDYR